MTRTLAVVAMMVVSAPGTMEAQGITVGLRAGMGRTKVDLEEGDGGDFRWKNGLLLGGFARAPMTETFGIQTGATYVRKGGRLLAENGHLTMDIDYLSVPALGVITAPTSGPLGWRLMGGPVVSFQLSCTLSGQVDGRTGEGLDCERQGIAMKSVDLGVQVGGGLTYDVGASASAFLDAGFEFGLINLNRTPEEGEAARNRTFAVSAGIEVPIG